MDSPPPPGASGDSGSQLPNIVQSLCSQQQTASSQAATSQVTSQSQQPLLTSFPPPVSTYPPNIAYQPHSTSYKALINSQPPVSFQPPSSSFKPPNYSFQPPSPSFQPSSSSFQPPNASSLLPSSSPYQLPVGLSSTSSQLASLAHSSRFAPRQEQQQPFHPVLEPSLQRRQVTSFGVCSVLILHFLGLPNLSFPSLVTEEWRYLAAERGGLPLSLTPCRCR